MPHFIRNATISVCVALVTIVSGFTAGACSMGTDPVVPECVELVPITSVATYDSLVAAVHPDSLRILLGDTLAVRYRPPGWGACP